jgi:hypothetical protein
MTNCPPLDPELRRLGTLLAQLDRARALIAALLIATLDAKEAEMEAHS